MNNEKQSTGFSVHNVKPSQVTARVTVFDTFATVTIKFGSGEVVFYTETSSDAFEIMDSLEDYKVTKAYELDNEGNA